MPLQAQEQSRNLQFSAFGTLGVAGTDTHTVGYRRDGTQPFWLAAIDKPSFDMDTRFGVQLSSKLGEHWLATLQVVSRPRYDGTYKPMPSVACLAWNPGGNFQARAGYLPYDVLPNGDFSNIGYTYLWVRPPADVFGTLNITRLRGVELSQGFSLGSGASLQVRGYFGESADQVPAGGDLGVWDLAGGRVWGGALKVQAGPWRGRVAYSYFKLPRNLPQVPSLVAFQNGLRSVGSLLDDPRLAAAAAAVDQKGVAVRSLQAGGAWEQGPYQVQGTFLHSSSPHNFTYPTRDAGFVSFGYRLGDVVPFVTFSRVVTDRPSIPDVGALGALPPQYGALVPIGKALVGVLNQFAISTVADQHTLSAGLRWDFAEKADLKFQIDRVRANHSIGGVVSYDTARPDVWNGRMTVMSITLDFIFGGGR